MPDNLQSDRPERIVRGLGVSYALVLFVYLLASPFLAAVAPLFEPGSYARAEGAGTLLVGLPLPEPILDALRGNGILNEPMVFAGFYALLLSIPTLLWMGAIVAIHKYRDVLTMSVADQILQWSIVFIAIVSFATPVQVHDFWMSVAWGRAVADGLNPYYSAATDLAGLPLSGDIGQMTYGPLWALISGATAWLAGKTALGTALLSKLIIGGALVGVVYTVRSLMSDRSAAEKSMALLIVGWAPVALINGVADGHNDSMIVLPMLLWFLFMERGKLRSAGAALGASIAIKYVTLPFLGLHVIRGLTGPKSARGRWTYSVFVALAVALGIGALYYRSPEFFNATVAMQSGKFFTPGTVLDDAVIQLGLSRTWLPGAVDVVIIGVAAVAVIRELRRRSNDGFRTAALWTMFALMLGVVAHVWPWFLLWVLGLAAIQPAKRIAWFAVGMAAAAPFILIPWTIDPELAVKHRLTLPGILLYGCGAAFVLSTGAVRRYLRQPVSARGP